MAWAAIGTGGRRGALRGVVVSGLLAASVFHSNFIEPAAAQFGWFGPSEASPQDIYNTIAEHGFRLVGPLYRNGRVYLADVLDRRQRRERLVIAADSGQIVQRYFVETSEPERRMPAAVARNAPRDRNDSFFSNLTRGWDDETPPRPPAGLNGPESDFDGPRFDAQQPRARPRPEPRVVTRTDVAPVTASPLPPPVAPTRTAPAAPEKKPDVPQPSPSAATPASPVPPSTRATTVVTDPLRIPGARKTEEPKAASAVAATKPVEATATPKPAAPASKPAGDVPVAPLD